MVIKSGKEYIWTGERLNAKLVIKVIGITAPDGKVSAKVLRVIDYGKTEEGFRQAVKRDIDEKKPLWFNISNLSPMPPESLENK